MKSDAHKFVSNAQAALHDLPLQNALGRARSGFVDKRRTAVQALPEFEALKRAGQEIKEQTLSHLDLYLERFEAQVEASGGQLHWARDGAEARRIVLDLCRSSGARKIAKGKSMVSEEIALNEALENAGLEVVETDLGEYIIQLAGEPPSHIIAPAVHKTRQQIAQLFRSHHRRYGLDKPLETIPEIVDEARKVLRNAFLDADLGITGANFLVADTGSAVIVTNEGNGDLSASLPKTHIVLASIEKLVPTLEDATVLLRLLGRSATGQEITTYTTLFTGPAPKGGPGPEQFHVLLLDNGRSEMLDSEFRDMMRCIRCGACLNHCPIYGAIGGHAYGWVYPGPMGAVLTPWFLGEHQAPDLPNASTLCGRCEEVCPMSIPLPSLLRRHRVRQYGAGLGHTRYRWGMAAWSALVRRPALYRLLSGLAARLLARLGGRSGRLSRVPAGRSWTSVRDLPAPEGRTFQQQWRTYRRRGWR